VPQLLVRCDADNQGATNKGATNQGARRNGMRCGYCEAPYRMVVREVPKPSPGAGEVLVRVQNCGVCGSDLHFYTGHFPPPAVCPGHEISGQVAAVGSGVSGWKEGDAVVVEPLLVCRECGFCRTGNYQLCPQLRLLGTMADGGFADFVRVPAYCLFRVPAGLDPAVAALAEPLAVNVHGLRLAGLAPGDRVLVLGAGTIGLLAVAAARAGGAGEIWISARYPHQAEMARQLGAQRVFTGQQAALELSAATQEIPPDIVVETVGGQADTVSEAAQAVRRGGTVVVLGVFTSAPALPALLLVVKEVRIVGSMTYGRTIARADFEWALEILSRDPTGFARLITHRFELAELASAFATAADKRSGAIKVSVAASAAP
jgi:L-iditol 2-dehydrogenase